MTARVFHDGAVSTPRLDHPEGIAVHPDGSIWCGGELGQLYRISPDGQEMAQVACTDGFALGVDIDAAGRVYLCDMLHRAVFCYEDDTGLQLFSSGGDRPFGTPNMVRAAADGWVYVTDSHRQGEPGGGVYRFDRTGAGGLWWSAPMDFANGIDISADLRGVYVVETFAHQVSRIPVRLDGTPGAKEVVLRLPGVLPDGVTVGPDGGLYVACYEPSQVLRVDPATAEVSTVVADVTAHLLCHPTNVAFRGSEMFTSNLGRWHITVVEDVIGR